MKAFYLLLLLPWLSNAEQQPVSNKHEILKKVYFDCRKKSDVMTCVDKASTFGKQIGFDKKNGSLSSDALDMSLFFLVQDDLSGSEKNETSSNEIKKAFEQ